MSNETSNRPKPNIRTTGKWVLGVPFLEATFVAMKRKRKRKKSLGSNNQASRETDAEGVCS